MLQDENIEYFVNLGIKCQIFPNWEYALLVKIQMEYLLFFRTYINCTRKVKSQI